MKRPDMLDGSAAPTPSGSYPHPDETGFSTQRAFTDGGARPPANPFSIFHGLLERRWWFLITVLTGLAFTLIYSIQRAPVFQATATVQILREDPVSTEFTQVVDSRIRNTEDFNTQTRLLESVVLARRVLERLSHQEKLRLIQPYYARHGSSNIEPVNVLLENRIIDPVRLSLMVHIQFKHPDASLCALVANLYAEEFLRYNVHVRSEGIIMAIEGLRHHAEEQRLKVERSEMALALFKEKHKNLSFDEATSIDQQQILLLSSELTRRQMELNDARGLWEQVATLLRKEGNLEELDFLRSNPVVMHLTQQLSELRVQAVKLSGRYRDQHPRMKEALGAVRRVEQELESVILMGAKGVENACLRAEELYNQTLVNLHAKQDEIVQRQKLQVEYNSMQREHEINQQMYQYFHSRMEQAISQAGEPAPNVRIVDQAVMTSKPVSPGFAASMVAGTFLSLILATGLTLAVIHFDDRIKSISDVEDRLQLPVLGVVTEVTGKENFNMGQIVAKRMNHVTVEEFRTLRSSLSILSEPRRLLLVTSVSAMEGKSFVACNLAASFAAHEDRTLLVDCDLRRPQIAQSLGIPLKPGLIQHLRDQVPLDEVICKNVVPGLDVLPSGGSTDHATELLGRFRLAKCAATLAQRYDRVIFDTPPAGVVSDAFGLLPQMDGVILIIKSSTLPFYRAERIIRLLKGTRAPMTGAILNFVNARSPDYYYDRSYEESSCLSSEKA